MGVKVSVMSGILKSTLFNTINPLRGENTFWWSTLPNTMDTYHDTSHGDTQPAMYVE